jgi:hypothetical protein
MRTIGLRNVLESLVCNNGIVQGIFIQVSRTFQKTPPFYAILLPKHLIVGNMDRIFGRFKRIHAVQFLLQIVVKDHGLVFMAHLENFFHGVTQDIISMTTVIDTVEKNKTLTTSFQIIRYLKVG